MDPGTQQDQRLPAALRPGFLRPDELNLAQRLRATLYYASRLAFIDPQGRQAGHWGEALERDESFVLADIAVYPVERIRDAFLQALSRTTSEALMPSLWALAGKVDRWHRLLKEAESPAGQAVARALASEIEGRLGEALRLCLPGGGQAFFGDQGLAGSMSPLWGLEGRGHASPETTAAGADGFPSQEHLRKAALGVAQSITALQSLALDRLPASLRSGRHDPSLGLLIAFLQLHERAQEPLNRFSERLTDFYYYDILGMRPRPAALESVHLLLDVDPSYTGEVKIEKGLRFAAGRDAQGAALEFSADQAGPLSKARVAALCTLNLEYDPLISPEHELGFASRVQMRRLALAPPEAADGPKPDWWPLFGGQAGDPDARLGFAVSSPLFELGEGERELRVALQLSHPSDRDPGLHELLKSPPRTATQSWLAQVFERYLALSGVGAAPPKLAPELAAQALLRSRAADPSQHLRFLVALCLAQSAPQLLRASLGSLFSAWLTAAAEDLLPEDLAALKSHAQAVLGRGSPAVLESDDPLTLIFGERPPERALLFGTVFKGLWKAKLSTASGWLTLNEVFCSFREIPSTGNGPARGCVELLLRVGASQPPLRPCSPVVHGAQWPAQPLLQVELQTQTRLFGYSLLRRLEWREMELSVSVQGLRNLVVHNQIGRLDPGKPFQAFGPLPQIGSYFLLGSAEIAAKPLRSMRVRLEWGQLPREEGGFEERYAAYPGLWEAPSFQVSPGFLRDGQWQGGGGPPLRLFSTLPGRRRVDSACTLELDPLDLRRHYRASPGLQEASFEYGSRARSGFFRFELAGPEAAFGHGLHGRLLTETLTRNARLKRSDPLPAEPYTPVIQWLQVDYQAGMSLRTAPEPDKPGDSAEGAGLHRVFHLHPFGHEEVYPGPAQGRRFLIPPIAHRGNLYLGLQTEDPQGRISLFFHLRQESAAEPDGLPRPSLKWAVWRPNGWLDLLPLQVVSDGTLGFLRSGIVHLDLPKGMSRVCPGLPEAVYWLRLSADGDLEGFAGLYGVNVNAVRATRVRPPAEGDASQTLPSGTVHTPLRSLAGLRKARQIGPSFGRRAADTREQVLIRGGERLSHKGRASTAWDYERLLLDAYPGLLKVKAFENLAADENADRLVGLKRPGAVLVAVVPGPGASQDAFAAPRCDAGTLERMAEHLRRVASPAVRINVRNAAYERIQVRCAVRFTLGTHPGTGLRRLNQAIVRFLSPWLGLGRTPDFGWELRSEDLEARLRALDGVESLGRLSFLHTAEKGRGFHVLQDSARPDPTAAGDWGTRVEPLLPWSLALPARSHLIETSPDPGQTAPLPTGIDLLEVGDTFIIGRPLHDH